MLTSSQKKILAQLANRHGQKKSPYFVVEGLRCCREAIQRHPQWRVFTVATSEFLESENGPLFANDTNVSEVTMTEFRTLTETEAPQGILLVMRKPEMAPPNVLPAPYSLILDQIQEPGNMGTILRTAWALGLQSVWLTTSCADVFAPKVVRSGMGAQFALDFIQVGDLIETSRVFRELGGQDIWCAMPLGTTSVFAPEFKLGKSSALVVGNEGNGIAHPEVGRSVTIPMPGHAESLNVAQATTVLMFEALRKSLG